MRGLVVVFLAGLVGISGLLTWSFLPAAEVSPGFVEFEVAQANRGAIVRELGEAGLVQSPLLMQVYTALLAPGVEFRPRSHLLRQGASPRQLVRSLGEVGRRESEKVLIPEGVHRLRIAERLEAAGICSRSAFLKATRNRELLQKLGISATSAEGYLFPATYRFLLDEDPERVVSRLVIEAKERFAAIETEVTERPAELTELSLDRHRAVVLASVIERETAVADERPKIARVFLNRLTEPEGETGGRLESDATAIYGCLGMVLPVPESCSDFEGRPTPTMLRDSLNPYNSYRHAGLPPGPIGNPGEAAFRAVLAPADGSWLYFVASGRGGHVFNDTYEDHLKAVRRLRARRGSSREKERKFAE